jgi:hypothetical protein
LSSKGHTEMTGGAAEVSPSVGGKSSTFSGVIFGENLELEPTSHIVPSLRSEGFPGGSPDSRLEVLLEDVEGSTQVAIRHSNIPNGQAEGYNTG